jgi:hypothetical protein
VLQSCILTEPFSSDVDFDGGGGVKKVVSVVARALFIITKYLFPPRPRDLAGTAINSYTPKDENMLRAVRNEPWVRQSALTKLSSAIPGSRQRY